MDQVLLERDDTLAALLGAVEEAAAGRGSVVLVSGGAGIGKTSVLRAFARAAAARARVLLSALRRPDGAADARPAARRGARVRRAAGGGVRGRPAGRRRLRRGAGGARGRAADRARRRGRPLGRRRDARRARLRGAADRAGPRRARPHLPRRRARPGAPAAAPAGRRWPGARCTGCALPPLSRAAVRAAGGGHRRRRRRACTASPAATRSSSPRRWRRRRDAVPATVVEAVLARVARLGPACREALEQLSVVPSRIRFELAVELLGDRIDALAEAELGRRARGRRDSLWASATSWRGGRSSAACPRSRGGA